MVEQMDDMMQYAPPHHHYPLRTVRDQMANSGISSQVLEVTGHLAAALVDVAYEQGYLCNKNRSSSLPLQIICSDYFQSPTQLSSNVSDGKNSAVRVKTG
jgi:hypothetical protein